MIHSAEEYEKAVEASQILFGGATSEALHKLDEQTLLQVFEGVPQFTISKEQLGCDGKLHNEAVAHNLLQVVAAVVGAELHLLQAYSVKHISGYILGASQNPPQCFTQQ